MIINKIFKKVHLLEAENAIKVRIFYVFKIM